MVEKEKIQSIFKTIINLILEYQKINVTNYSKNTELISKYYGYLYNNIKNLISQLSNYQLRPNYDQDIDYKKRIAQQEKELEELKKKTQEEKDKFEFNIGQTKLDMDKMNSLLEDLNFMIEDL